MTDVVISFAFRLLAPAPLLTTNRERTLHWSKRAEIVRLWRQAAKVMAIQERVPQFAWVEIEACIAQARGVLADTGGHQPVIKAVVDGLVDARVVVNDDPEHVRQLLARPPLRESADAITLRLRGELRG